MPCAVLLLLIIAALLEDGSQQDTKIETNTPRHPALRRITEREGIVARGIARRAARRARMIMAIRAAYQRAAARCAGI